MLDSIMALAGVVGFITMAAAYGMVISDRLRRTGGTKGQPTLGRLKIPDNCRTDPHTRDFIVDLEHPDSRVISVLIPIDSDCWEPASTRIGGHEEPFGLNLVCSGHYT